MGLWGLVQNAPHRASLTMRVVGSFSRTSRDKGQIMAHAGRVTFDSVSETDVFATVRGETGVYEVELTEEEEGALCVSCTCPHFADQGQCCKHVWATLIMAEKEGHLSALTRSESLAPIDVVFPDGDAPHFLPEPLRAYAPISHQPSWKELERLADRPERGISPLAPPAIASSELWYRVVPFMQRVEIGSRRRMKKGGLGPFKSMGVENARAIAPTDDERDLLDALGRDAYVKYESRSADIAVTERTAARVLERIARTGRALVEDTELRFEGDVPWVLAFELAPMDSKWLVLRAFFRREEDRRDISAAKGLWPSIVFFEDGAHRLESKRALPWIERMRQAGVIRVPLSSRAEVIRMMARMDLPFDAAPLQTESIRPTPIVRFGEPSPYSAISRTPATIGFEYAGIEIAHDQSGRRIYDEKAERLIARDADFEHAALERLALLGFRDARGIVELGTAKLPAAVRALAAEGWHVEAKGRKYRTAKAFSTEITTGIDWFDLDAEADFGTERVPLPRLLAALKKGDDSIVLGDGTFGVLPEDWLRRWDALGELWTTKDGSLRFRRSQAGVLDAMLAAQPDVEWDAAFGKLRAALASFDGIVPVKEPKGFVGELRDYQRLGLGWLRWIEELGFGGCLADDMGLGKTVQVLALLAGRRKHGPSLVVAPRSVIFNWIEEASRFAPKLRVLDHTGAQRRAPGEHFQDHDLVLTTYGTLRRDAVALADVDFDYVILDEAQAIKNASAQAAKAARTLRSAHRLALTGTPIENHLGELWSLFEFLNPGMLGAAAAFKRLSTARSLEEPERATLARALRPFIMRRLKSQVAEELPDRVEQTLWCELEPEQRALYDEVRTHYRAALLGKIEKDGIEKSGVAVLEALLRLRQAACHPGLLDAARRGDSSAKLDTLFAQIGSVVEEGHKVLVFSQFTSLLSLVRERLDAQGTAYEYLDGATRDRKARVQRFQSDDGCRIFLVSLKAGGVGLNLTAAEYVYLLDPWWNPAVEAQAIDRAHRIGQNRTVFAYRLIAKDTVEEKVLALQKTKRELAAGLLDGAEGGLRNLTPDDVALLLS